MDEDHSPFICDAERVLHQQRELPASCFSIAWRRSWSKTRNSFVSLMPKTARSHPAPTFDDCAETIETALTE